MVYQRRVTVLVSIDVLLVFAAVAFGQLVVEGQLEFDSLAVLAIVAGLVCSYQLFASRNHLYKKAWSFASIGELMVLFQTITLSVISMIPIHFITTQQVNLRLYVVIWMALMLLIGGSRFSIRVLRDMVLLQDKSKKRTLIVGAGDAGAMVVRQLQREHDTDLQPVVFVDDDKRKHRLEILGVPVGGNIANIQETVQDYDIEHIIIAIPSLNKKEINKIYQACLETNKQTQIVPKIEELILGKFSVHQWQDVCPEDLLAREPIELATDHIAEAISDKVVLVTGAGGSIGSEICRQIANFTPSKLLLLGHGENSIYTIEMELKEKYKELIHIIPVIADIQDRERMLQVMKQYKPDIIYHAAAHKHVPLMEENPHEAVKNNIIGTKNVAEAAAQYEVESFVMVSTDKAVNPTSVMGATKRVAEMIVQNMNSRGKTKFVAVRFGNVLGSRGSVIPLFKKQIGKGGPVTVTHPEMERYFMTIPEASRLVIQAGTLANGGEIFVLDMGKPVKIVDLAKNLIKLSGFTTEEIGIHFTGIRPGEKLYEELLNANEVHEEQVHPKIHIGKAMMQDMEGIAYLLATFMTMDGHTLAHLLLDIAHHRTVIPQKPVVINT
ncbi:nucleoside-diphosphate sugar epimerase/dehydratase [Bacillus sp. FJAT-52991]|uniref:Nucleoside-diphosphate sugar epimerase/dehydratase n=1 Tax=Bacillus kandeliae TaxID=3129297 RepID=A0ABZ2N593_9BACI